MTPSTVRFLINKLDTKSLLLFSVDIPYSPATEISACLLVIALVDLHTNGTNQGTKA